MGAEKKFENYEWRIREYANEIKEKSIVERVNLNSFRFLTINHFIPIFVIPEFVIPEFYFMCFYQIPWFWTIFEGK